ncbi:MAG TPA: LytTR family DNA-binding domain-containing protein [Ideonella sp.]|uniref:LytR/AlgR family response regulator transcription factor n=1 Tax=Ideonella sp. TaxID=1929293 RepID=UPI002E371F35|nr:LytTR family DNA-binding domain-containing protein [Ideonella sp.]HEX5684836.1 LytTR family DNA-binding domain-containing protein [Ideonella sp.]
MDRLRVLIVDDEPLARMRLRSLLADCVRPAATVVDEAGSAAEALHALARQPVDAVLLDIHMPGMDGISLARKLREQSSAPAVVLVTAHAEHALQAFEVDAVDYLTKPVRRARLQEALGRVEHRLGRTPIPPPATSANAVEAPTLVVSDRGRVLRIPVPEVVYLRAEMKYVTLCTTKHRYVLDDALTDLEQRLGDAVVRIHRSMVVAKSAVRALERRVLPGAESEEGGESWAVQVEPSGEWLAVSRRQLPQVREVLARAG